MRRILTLFTMVLLAQAVDDGQLRRTAPGPSAVHVDRHINAHIEPRDGAPAASPDDRPSRETPPPPPAIGTTPPDLLPPAIPNPRDPLYRDRR